MKKHEDAIIAIEYIAQELKNNKIDDLAQILQDVTQLYFQQKNVNFENGEFDECSSVLYVYFIKKYYKNIKVKNYKNKVLDFFKAEIN